MPLNFRNALKNLATFCFVAVLSTSAFAEQGLFWKADTPSGKSIYLFGTIHTDDNRVTNFSPTVNNALQSVDAFMMETLAPSDPSVFLMQDATLTEMLTEQELDKVYALAEFHV